MNKITLTAADSEGAARAAPFEVERTLPKAVAPAWTQRLVRGIGIERFQDAKVPAIPFAAADAADVAAFVAAKAALPGAPATAAVVAPAGASADQIAALFEELESQIDAKQIRPGDTVFVYLETHYLDFDHHGALLGHDAVAGAAKPSLSADRVADILGRLTGSGGCTVVLLLDGVHKGEETSVDNWVRHLYRDQGVIVAVASRYGVPSRRLPLRRHGAFAQAILESTTARAQVRPRVAANAPLTLGDFQEALIAGVAGLTERQQIAEVFLPETAMSPREPLFQPRLRPGVDMASK